MPILQRDARPRVATQASLSYVTSPAERPVHYLYEPPPGTPRDNATYELQDIEIHDCRQLRSTLDREGFELHDAPSRVTDFTDPDQVIQRYYPEIAELARGVTGATHAYVFDHLVRKREPARPIAGLGERRGGAPGPAGRVHNDYTAWSGPHRLGLVRREPDATATRFAILTLWRPTLAAPVLDAPLALCDARSVAARELVATELRYRDRIGEIYLVTHAAGHRWSYAPAMTRDEIFVFKQYDSASDVARFTPHTAFEHRDAPADAVPRQSIEVRCLVTYD